MLRLLVLSGLLAVIAISADESIDRHDADVQDISGPDVTGGAVLPWFRQVSTALAFTMLQNEHVIDELGIVDDQQSQIATLQQSFNEQIAEHLPAYAKLPIVPMDARIKMDNEVFAPIYIRTRRRLATILLPFQNRRFSEIVFQITLPSVLAHESIVKELEYTEEQKQQLAKLLAPQGRHGRRSQPPIPLQPRKSEPNLEQCLELLTDEQKQKYQAIVGEPFDIYRIIANRENPYAPAPVQPEKK